MPTKILFFILPHTHLMDLAGPDQVFLEAIDYGADLEIEYCSYTNNIGTSAGLPFGKVKHFSKINCKKGDFIFIPGADIKFLHSKEFKSQKEIFAWINTCHEQGINICSICTGSFVLAQSGILDHKNCTTHWKRTAELKQLYPKLNVIENVLFTQEDGIYTSAGIASGIDMALHIIEELKDEYFAHKVARELVIYNRRKGNHSQQSVYTNYRNHIHSGIHKVQDRLQENIHQKISLTELAELASMSDRNLTRIFKKETGLTIHEYINLLRKEKINELLNNPDLSRTQIAQQIGLKSERHLIRLIHAQ
ncbi:MAG: DJ-1/PfpI family protein [Chitinophagales bacterium]